MAVFKLKEVICNQYNRIDVDRYKRSVLFLIENLTTGYKSLFQLDRIGKNIASLRCNDRKCNHRLSIQHYSAWRFLRAIPYIHWSFSARKNLHEFKTKMIQKRGLIECYGETKMNKARRSV